MRRAPRFGPYRILERVATTAEGAVYRAFDFDRTMAEVLVITTPDTGPGASWSARTERLPAELVITTGAEGVRRWVVLPLDQTQAAVELIGLDRPPTQNWLAAAWGWPHPYAKTGPQLLVRIVWTILGAMVLVAIFWLVRALVR